MYSLPINCSFGITFVFNNCLYAYTYIYTISVGVRHSHIIGRCFVCVSEAQYLYKKIVITVSRFDATCSSVL